jgi:YVTN family beta-propeller protein
MVRKGKRAVCLSIWLLFGLCVDTNASPFAYIPNSGSNTVSVIDTATSSVVATVLAGTTPYGVATLAKPSETFTFITNYGSDNVSVIRTFSNLLSNVVFEKVRDIAVGRNPYGIAVDPAGTYAYVTNSVDGTVSKIDLNNYTVAGTIPVGFNPIGIVVTPDNTGVYVVNNASGTVSVISTVDNTKVVTLPVGINPFGIAVKPDGSCVYVTNSGDGSVSVIKTADHSVITKKDLHFATPSMLAVNSEGTLAYITNFSSGSITLFDTTTNAVSNPNIAVGINPLGLSLSTDGLFTYVVNSFDGTVSVIDNTTNTEKQPRIKVGTLPRALGSFTAPFGKTVPSVISTTPSNSATDISRSASIQATFSDDMDPSTINSLTFLVSGEVTGTVTYGNVNRTATFKPVKSLIKDNTYTVTLTTDMRNKNGNALQSNYTWSFKTSNEEGSCFIATAIYGSYDDVNVQILRRFRDKNLLPYKWGAALVDSYYHYSPSIADFIRENNSLRTPAQWILMPVVYFVQYPSHLAWLLGLGFIILIGMKKAHVCDSRKRDAPFHDPYPQ